MPRDNDERHRPFAIDLGGGLQAVPVAQLDIGDDQIRTGVAA
jgi:hypothetical protein